MAAAVQSPLARQAASAKALLAALDERDRLLTQLNQVIDAIVHARVIGSQERAARMTLAREIAEAAAMALESHERLVARAQLERDRLAGAVERSTRPDTVARQYSNAGRRRSAGLSVTG
jgi:hypothetical protein